MRFVRSGERFSKDESGTKENKMEGTGQNGRGSVGWEERLGHRFRVLSCKVPDKIVGRNYFLTHNCSRKISAGLCLSAKSTEIARPVKWNGSCCLADT